MLVLLPLLTTLATALGLRAGGGTPPTCSFS